MKRAKVKRYAGEDDNLVSSGSDSDSGDGSTSVDSSADEDYVRETRKTAQDTSAPAKKAPVVTKEQLAASGLSLRDYLNKQQGLTRRGDFSKASDSYRTEGASKPAPEAKYRTEGANKKPTGNLGGGKYASEAGTYTDLRNPANARDIYSAPDRFSLKNVFRGRNSPSQGMKKGGSTSSVSSASKRGDGIATRGKPRGKYL